MPLRVACRAGDNDKHDFDVTFLLFHNSKLYSAADDGKIKLWSQDVIKIAEVDAHPCSVFCLAANEDTLFSCSNDGTIKLWDLDTLKEIGTLVKSTGVEYWRVAFSENCLFSGDDQGNISIYKNKKLYGQVNIAEPINDMAVYGNLVFTVKDLDLVITEIKLEGEHVQYGTKTSFMGRAPVAIIGDHLFAFITREGKEIQLHENSLSSTFKPMARITDGSEMIINALAGVVWEKEHLFSGGWDRLLKQWTIDNNYPINIASVDVDIVINAIACGQKNHIYVGGADGHVLRVDVV